MQYNYLTLGLKVEKVVHETHDTITICFQQPRLKKIKYLPGQYITIIVNINGRKYKRPYSISSAFGVDSTLNITIKRIKNGIVSNFISDTIKEGDIVEAIEPIGDFIYEREKSVDKTIFLWGAGSGITPLNSIIKTVLTNESSHNRIILIYSNPTIGSIIFRDELSILQEKFPTRFFIEYFITQEDISTNFGTAGRINAAQIELILKKYTTDKSGIHYICGPEKMKQTVCGTLSEFEIPASAILSESYTHHLQESDLVNVVNATIAISNRQEEQKFNVAIGKSVLEAGLDALHDIPYSCQNGTCKICKCRLLKGQAKMVGVSNTKDLHENEYLLCSTYPLTEFIEFEIV